jgi:hypothetical protein
LVSELRLAIFEKYFDLQLWRKIPKPVAGKILKLGKGETLK